MVNGEWKILVMENIGTYIIGIKNEWMEDVGWKPPKH